MITTTTIRCDRVSRRKTDARKPQAGEDGDRLDDIGGDVRRVGVEGR